MKKICILVLGVMAFAGNADAMNSKEANFKATESSVGAKLLEAFGNSEEAALWKKLGTLIKSGEIDDKCNYYRTIDRNIGKENKKEAEALMFHYLRNYNENGVTDYKLYTILEISPEKLVELEEGLWEIANKYTLPVAHTKKLTKKLKR